MGLGYQWSLDLASPLSLTPQHKQYVLVMIEHISKWLELVLLLDCSNDNDVRKQTCEIELVNKKSMNMNEYIGNIMMIKIEYF
jgi:hypothetical protein